MKRVVLASVCILSLLVLGDGFAQSKLGIGMNLGAQRIFGDRKSPSFAPAGEGVLSYRVAPFADLAIAVGYGMLKYVTPPGSGTTTTDMVNAELRGNLEVVSKGPFRPYLTVGVGLAHYKIREQTSRVSDGLFIGGGGFKFMVNPMFDIYASADYRFTTGDTFDSTVLEGKSKDGYLNLRTGVTYYLGGGRHAIPQIIADERAPFIELGDEPYAMDDDEAFDQQPVERTETKNMEEYVRLKSKVDQLVGNLDSHESEISDLQRKLTSRASRLGNLETKASQRQSVKLRSNSNMSSFADVYQEALTQFYNKNHSEAVSLFRLLLQQYPSHSLAGNCQFWLGQSLYTMDQYQEAIDEFFKVLSFDRSLKKDDALFYLGKVYLKLGSGERARESFARLMRDYPRSEYVSRAKNYVDKL